MTCKANEFQCVSPKYCIFADWKCDNETDCSDGSDEVNCTRSCPPGQFLCQNQQCIQESWKCDGDPDCSDGSDELLELCKTSACEPGRFRCDNHKCIPKMLVCNGHNDCGDNSDETSEVCKIEHLCPPDQFKCRSGECISMKLRCDGFNDCGDNYDELKCPFYFSETCEPDDKNCTAREAMAKSSCQFGHCSQICIEKKNSYTCKCEKGYESIEREQVKIVNKGKEKSKNPKKTDKEDSGESKTKPHFASQDFDLYSCRAKGNKAALVVASESEMRILSPYKSLGSDKQVTQGKPFFKIQNIDILFNGSENLVFFTDHFKKRIMKFVLTERDLNTSRSKREVDYYNSITADMPFLDGKKIANNKHLEIIQENSASVLKNFYFDFADEPEDVMNSIYKSEKSLKAKPLIRAKRDAENPKIIVENLQDPRAISIDWVAKRLYYINKFQSEESAVVTVSTLDGRKKTTIVTTDLKDPFDIVVDPKNGYVFFTDCNHYSPKIERSYMDGSVRRKIVTEKIIWPSGISIDYPASRLYFVDTKLKTMESVDLDGENRIIVKNFHKEAYKPYRIEVFEDYVYMSLYQDDNVLKLHKFGKGETKSIAQGVKSRISDISIVQEKKQDKDLYNPCENDPCHESALCVIGPPKAPNGSVSVGKSCLCPDLLQKFLVGDNSTNSSMVSLFLKYLFQLICFINLASLFCWKKDFCCTRNRMMKPLNSS